MQCGVLSFGGLRWCCALLGLSSILRLFVMHSEVGNVPRSSEQKGGFIERRLCMARGFKKEGLSSGPGALLSHSCARKDSYLCLSTPDKCKWGQR